MNELEAVDIFRSARPELEVTRVIDFDSKYYIVEAVKEKGVIDYNDPYYAVRKADGKILNFYPIADLEKFVTALKNRSRSVDSINSIQTGAR